MELALVNHSPPPPYPKAIAKISLFYTKTLTDKEGLRFKKENV